MRSKIVSNFLWKYCFGVDILGKKISTIRHSLGLDNLLKLQLLKFTTKKKTIFTPGKKYVIMYTLLKKFHFKNKYDL